MQANSVFLTAIATIAASIIAGGVAFLTAVLSKEQKTSEFRQTWIDRLREDVAFYAGATDVLHSTMKLTFRRSGKDALIEFLQREDRRFQEAVAAYHRIRLRLNHAEHGALLKALSNVNAIYYGSHIGDSQQQDRIAALLSAVERETVVILKREWQRVKRGEWSFIIAKYLSLALLAAGGVSLILYLTGHVVVDWR